MNMNVSQPLLIALLASASATATTAHAQAAPEAAGAEEPAKTGLQDIVVTARKRTESLQNVPAAISAISAEELARRDVTSLENVAAMTPNFVIGRSGVGSGASLAMRGVGSNFTSLGIEQSVAVIVDGVYYGQGSILNEAMFDVAGVEILKGPQALFYGKNATAGVLSLTTADPTDELEIMARAGYEFGAKEVIGEGVISGPLTGTLSARLAVRGSRMFEGYFKNGALPVIAPLRDSATGVVTNYTLPPAPEDQPGTRQAIARLSLKWEPSPSFTATIKGSLNRTKYKGASFNSLLVDCPVGGNPQLDPRFPCENERTIYHSNLPPEVAESFPFARDGALYGRYKSETVTGTFDYSLDNIAITAVTNYQQSRDERLSHQNAQMASVPGSLAIGSLASTWESFSAELRALTRYDAPVNMLIAGYYQSTKYKLLTYAFDRVENTAAADLRNRFVSNTRDSGTDGDTASLYGQLIWNPVDAVEATAGVRYIHETKDSLFNQPYVNPLFAAQILPNVPVTANQSFDKWLPEATIRWSVTPDVSLYGAYKTGYKSGGFSNSLRFTPNSDPNTAGQFGPESASGFEAGLRAMLFDRSLRFNVTAYSYKFTGLQLDYFDSAAVTFVTTNAGTSRTKGVELEAQWAPRGVDGLTLYSSAAYNKARYTRFMAPCNTGQTPAQGCPVPPPGVFPLQDLAGAPLLASPRWVGSLGLSYESEISSGWKAGLSVDGRYSGSYLASVFADPNARQKSYATLDASARIATVDDRWELALIGKNLTDTFYVNGTFGSPRTGSATVPADLVGLVSLPRSVQLRLTWRY